MISAFNLQSGGIPTTFCMADCLLWYYDFRLSKAICARSKNVLEISGLKFYFTSGITCMGGRRFEHRKC